VDKVTAVGEHLPPTQADIPCVRLDAVDSPRAKLVLLYLAEHGPTAPRQLADELDEPLLTILGVVDTLCREDLVERRDGRICLVED